MFPVRRLNSIVIMHVRAISQGTQCAGGAGVVTVPGDRRRGIKRIKNV